jgi:hypothetical protein
MTRVAGPSTGERGTVGNRQYRNVMEASMKTSLLAAVALASFALSSPALADGKCGDGHRSAPFEFSKEELVTTWASPIPQNSKVAFANSAVFESASRDMGADTPSGFPEKYSKNLKQVELFNQSISWSVEQLVDVEKRYGFIIDKGDDALPIFEKYASTKHNFITVLVQHPSVSSPRSFSSCSVVLQRGIIEYADGKETLFLRSYFHSKNDAGDFVNFVPQGGLQITFPSQEIWFPLSLTKVIPEPASYVVLDILTPKALDPSRLGAAFRAEGGGKEIKFNGKSEHAIRVIGKFESGKDLEDLRLRPQ